MQSLGVPLRTPKILTARFGPQIGNCSRQLAAQNLTAIAQTGSGGSPPQKSDNHSFG